MKRAILSLVIKTVSVFAASALLTSCGAQPSGDQDLTSRTYVELVDWHISGLWVINSPVAWVRVANYNNKPIKEVTIQYNTFDSDGTPLDQGTTVLSDHSGTEVAPGSVKNFIEQYLGLVQLRTDKLSIKLLSVAAD